MHSPPANFTEDARRTGSLTRLRQLRGASLELSDSQMGRIRAVAGAV